ncbi:MAG: hypothetical protein Roseis2KO_45770 [Roseivirga sp.]
MIGAFPGKLIVDQLSVISDQEIRIFYGQRPFFKLSQDYEKYLAIGVLLKYSQGRCPSQNMFLIQVLSRWPLVDSPGFTQE